jgi:hypothetical protein
MSGGGAGSASFQPADEGRQDAGAPRYVHKAVKTPELYTAYQGYLRVKANHAPGGRLYNSRRSVHAILSNAPGGLTFPELVEAVRTRQGHTVHQGTIRAVLSTGGFTKRNGRWFAAPDPSRGARTLRQAMAQALVNPQPAHDGTPELARPPDLPTTVRAIHNRLHELVKALHATSQSDESCDRRSS